MKQLFISTLFIFSGLSSFANNDSEVSKLFDRKDILKAMSGNPRIIEDSELNCDAELIRNKLNPMIGCREIFNLFSFEVILCG